MDLTEEARKIREAQPTRRDIEAFFTLKTWRGKLARVPDLDQEHTTHTLRLACRRALIEMEWPEWTNLGDQELVDLLGSDAYVTPVPQESDLVPLFVEKPVKEKKRRPRPDSLSDLETPQAGPGLPPGSPTTTTTTPILVRPLSKETAASPPG